MTMIKKFAVIAGMFAWPAAAYAEPAHLDCEVITGGQAFTFQLTTDEETSTVMMHGREDGSIQKMEGVFTADKVIFSNRFMTYTLSRVDLTIVRDIPSVNTVNSGTCKVIRTPERAF